VSILGFPNIFIVQKIKQKVENILLTKGAPRGVARLSKHWDASMKSWVQTNVLHV